jgi:hypothetical protein
MNHTRTLKEIFNTKPDRARSVGIPKLRWEDGVVQDMRILGVKNWRKVALETNGQNSLRRQGPTRGCRANDDDDDDDDFA